MEPVCLQHEQLAPQQHQRPRGSPARSRGHCQARERIVRERPGLAAFFTRIPAGAPSAGDRGDHRRRIGGLRRWCRCARARGLCASIRSRSTGDSPVAELAGPCCRPARLTRADTGGTRSPSKCATTTHRRSRFTRAAASACLASTRTTMRTGRPRYATKRPCFPSRTKRGTIRRLSVFDRCETHLARARGKKRSAGLSCAPPNLSAEPQGLRQPIIMQTLSRVSARPQRRGS